MEAGMEAGAKPGAGCACALYGALQMIEAVVLNISGKTLEGLVHPRISDPAERKDIQDTLRRLKLGELSGATIHTAHHSPLAARRSPPTAHHPPPRFGSRVGLGAILKCMVLTQA